MHGCKNINKTSNWNLHYCSSNSIVYRPIKRTEYWLHKRIFTHKQSIQTRLPWVHIDRDSFDMLWLWLMIYFRLFYVALLWKKNLFCYYYCTSECGTRKSDLRLIRKINRIRITYFDLYSFQLCMFGLWIVEFFRSISVHMFFLVWCA